MMRSRHWVLIASFAFVGALACGEDGQPVAGCPKLPLYRLVDEGTMDNPKWVAVLPDGGPLSAGDQARLTAAENAKCITPLGTAVSLFPDAAAPTSTTSANALSKSSGAATP